jgi:hypothetical protein
LELRLVVPVFKFWAQLMTNFARRKFERKSLNKMVLQVNDMIKTMLNSSILDLFEGKLEKMTSYIKIKIKMDFIFFGNLQI